MHENSKVPPHLFAEHPPLDAIERLFDLSLDLLGVASVFGYLTLLSPSWERVLGWSNEELMSEPYVEFVHFDDVAATIEASRQLALPGSAPLVGFENRYRTTNGTYRAFEWNVVAENNSLYFVAHDVTFRKELELERTRAEETLRAIIDNVDDGIYVTDSRDRITLINPAAVRMLGYRSEQELLDRDPHAMFHQAHGDVDDSAVADCPLAKVSTLGHAVHVDLDAFWRQDRTMIPVSYTSLPLERSDDIGSVVTFRDMTEEQAELERLRAVVVDVEWLEQVRDALAGDRFVLYSQPVIDLANRATIKHELFLRMLGLNGEVVTAREFLPVAEKFGLISAIDKWVVTKGVELAAQGYSIAINLSFESILNDDILLHIENELARTEAEPRRLIVELTESAVAQNINECRNFADRLVSNGCLFALDDFGTGNAPLDQLRELPITYVKIDGRFAHGITKRDEDSGVVEALVLMAQSLGEVTIAEGIEDEKTFEKMRDIGVDLGQGYFIGRPSLELR